MHGVQNLSKAFPSQQKHDEVSTPRMERHIEASEKSKGAEGGGFIRRGWELVHAEGDAAEVKDVRPNREKSNRSNSTEDGSCLGLRRLLLRLVGWRN